MPHRLLLAATTVALVLVLLAVSRPAGESATASAAECTVAAAGDLSFTVDAGSGPRPVLLHVPPGASGRELPLVLGLGGVGQTGPQFASATGYSRLADRERFLVAYPTASRKPPVLEHQPA